MLIAHKVNAQYLPKGKAYEVLTWYTQSHTEHEYPYYGQAL